MPVKVAEEWLNICGGCEVTILDIGEKLLDIHPQLAFVHMPVLMDHKYFGQTGERTDMEIPEADVGIISGGVRNEKEKHVTVSSIPFPAWPVRSGPSCTSPIRDCPLPCFSRKASRPIMPRTSSGIVRTTLGGLPEVSMRYQLK